MSESAKLERRSYLFSNSPAKNQANILSTRMDTDSSMPTASVAMMQPGKVINGTSFKNNKSEHGRRHRSKSEGHELHHATNNVNDVMSGSSAIMKAAKEKNQDRKARNMKGRGLPKKGGAGGKGTWGKAGEIYEEEDVDSNDPNYDSDNEEFVIEHVTPELHKEEFQKQMGPLMQEYYDHGDTKECADLLSSWNISHLKHQITSFAIALAMDKKAPQREMTSRLLSDLYGHKVLKEEEVELGFQALMNSLSDLTLDTPEAPVILGQFMARAIADDILNPSFVNELEHPSDLGRKALDKANTLLKMKHGIVRLDNVWGVGGGLRPVKVLTKKIILLLREYLCSRDTKEAGRCVQELDVPHFHHEIVYEAILLVLESGTEAVMNSIIQLLKDFSDSALVTRDQIIAGFQRAFKAMEDIVLDNPHAYRTLATFVDQCARSRIITLSLRDKAPTRGRKRFVSEGDGGIMKM